MAEGAALAAQAGPEAAQVAPGARQAAAGGGIPRRMLSEPGEPAERSAAARASGGAGRVRGGTVRSGRSYLPPDTPPAIAAQAGRGRPLPASSAAEFGSRLAADLSQVRIHDDARAAALAEAAGARAFTIGSHVFFNRGEHQPGTGAGRALLAHELAHAAEYDAGPARLLRQPKGEVTEASDSDIQVQGMPAPPAPARESFVRLLIHASAMDEAAQILAANLPAGQQPYVFIGMSPHFFKVYDSQGQKLGRADTKGDEGVKFLPGVYIWNSGKLVAVTQSDLHPERLGQEKAAQGSSVLQRKLTDDQAAAIDAAQKKAAAGQRAPSPKVTEQVPMAGLLKDPGELSRLIALVPDAAAVFFVPSFEASSGRGKGGGDRASPYASPIESRGDGQPPNAGPWPVTVKGPKLVPIDADPTFEAMVDWSANGNWGFSSQVITQVGENIHYRWELFDITEYASKEAARAAKSPAPGDASAPPRKTLDERVKEFTESGQGTGTNVTGHGGANREFAREFEDWWSDSKRAARGVAHPHGDTQAERLENAQLNMLSLEMTPASLLITTLHAAIRWFADLFAGPRKQQEIPLENKGIFLIRVITTPAIGEDLQGNPVIRPPSVDAKLVEVAEMDRAVEESLDDPEAQLAELTAQIADARKHGYDEKAKYLQSLFDAANERFFGSPLVILEKRRAAAQKDLEDYRRDFKASSDYTKQQNVDKLDEQIAAYHRHEDKRTAGQPGLPAAGRVSATLISEVTGEQYPLLLTAGPMAQQDGQDRWMISDITSDEGRSYTGLGSKPSEAFGSALEQFGNQAAYGRGRIGARTAGLGLEKGAPGQIFVDSAPADGALVEKRLDDLVATLALLGLAIETLGVGAAIVGAVAAAEHLLKQWDEKGHLSLSSQTVGDVLGVLGGLAAGSQIIAGLRVARFERAFTMLKEGAATEAELARAGELVASARTLEAAVEIGNEVIGYAGLVWGNAAVIDNILAVNAQEAKGTITHAAARRARAEAFANAIQTNGIMIASKVIRARKAAGAAARIPVPREVPAPEVSPAGEPAGEARAGDTRAAEQDTGEPAAGEAHPGQREQQAAQVRPVTAGTPRDSTLAELRQVLPPDVRDLLRFGRAEGDTVRIHWQPDADGLVSDITIHVGPETSPENLRLHIETVRTMQKYQGLSGKLRRALAWVSDLIGVDHQILDSRDPRFNTQLEIQKLVRLSAVQLNALEAMTPGAREAAETQYDILRSQLEEHMAALDIGEIEPGAGVAARGVSRRNLPKYKELLARLHQEQPGSDAHRKIRRQIYELTGGTMEIEPWTRVYQANMQNPGRGSKAVAVEKSRLGWPEHERPFEMKSGPDRRMDLADPLAMQAAEVKAYGSGTVNLNPDILEEATRDAEIVAQGWQITWIFVDCEPSGPLQGTLLSSGIAIDLRRSSGGSTRRDALLYPMQPVPARR